VERNLKIRNLYENILNNHQDKIDEAKKEVIRKFSSQK
jgi:hypothetical protein